MYYLEHFSVADPVFLTGGAANRNANFAKISSKKHQEIKDIYYGVLRAPSQSNFFFIFMQLLAKIMLINRGSSDSIKVIELIWKTMIGSLELKFLLPILFLLYVVLLLPVTVNNYRNYTL